jgi:thioredoxin reductase
MYAAMTLKKRGHQVTLFEKSDALGGQIKTARYPTFKWRLRRYLDYLIGQMDRQQIDVRLQTEATPELLAAGNYDVILAATGAVPKAPNIPGAEYAKWNIVNIYGHAQELGEKVVVIGGSSGAAEGAIYLAQNGHQVIELSRKNIVGYDLNPVHARGPFNMKSRVAGVQLIKNAKTTRIQEHCVYYLDENGQEQSIPCDDILAAGGMAPENKAALAFYGLAKEFYCIGDAREAGTMRTAIRDAYAVAVRI